MALSKTNEEDEFRIPRMYYEEEKAKKVAAALPDKMQKHFRDKLKQKAKIEKAKANLMNENMAESMKPNPGVICSSTTGTKNGGKFHDDEAEITNQMSLK